jgi:hypothetical protein
MMKRFFVLGLSLVALFAMQSSNYAFGGIFCHHHHHGCAETTCGGCGGCGTGCGAVAAPCAPVVAAPVAPTVTYVDQTVTTYTSKWVAKQVPVQVRKMVSKTVAEPYTYNVLVPVTTPKVRTETYCEQVMVAEPYTYTEMVSKVTPTPQQVTTYTCVPRVVTETYPVCHRVKVCCCDPCTGRTHHHWETVTELCTRCRTCYDRVPSVSTVTVNVVTCTPIPKTGTHNVCKLVPKTRQVPYNEVSYKTESKTTTVNRVVCDWVTETVMTTVNECVTTPVTTVVKVPVTSPCSTGCGYEGGCGGGCGSSCDSGCGHHHHHHLFHRHHGCG